MAFVMFWQILWALLLGFTISAVVQAVAHREQIAKLLPDDSPRSLLKACGLGAASSSCSYAATAIARSLFRKGANFTSAIAFEFASTNLVIELGILLIILLGWQFMAAEFVGGVVMIALLAVIFRFFLKRKNVDEARAVADKGVAGVMEGHAAMDMTIRKQGTLWQRATSGEGVTAISHYLFMDIVSLWKDIGLGLVISGFLAVLVPAEWWKSLFYTGHGAASSVWGAAVGPIVSMLSFVCSIGNVPMAAVLWNGGISFGGVIAFIFADLLILPILNIYRKYYGVKMMVFLFIASYAAMVLAGLAIEGLFSLVGLIPTHAAVSITETTISWDYTTVLNILFLIPAALMLVRFLKTGGPAMLRMMDMSPEEMAHHHHGHDHGDHAHHDHAAPTHDCCAPQQIAMPVVQASCCHPAEAAAEKPAAEHVAHDHAHHEHGHHH